MEHKSFSLFLLLTLALGTFAQNFGVSPQKNVFITEVYTSKYLPSSSWLEVWNSDSLLVDMNGWKITIASDLSLSHTLNISILADSYFVFTQPRLGLPFRPEGDTFYLLDNNGLQVHRFITGPASTPTSESVIGYSYGRYVTTDSKEHFVQSRTLTRGFNNDIPRLSPLSIIEIMYNPAPGDDQYIVLENTQDSALNLFLKDYPLITWRIGGVIQFNMPNTTIIGPRKKMILTNAASPDAFRTKKNVPPYVQIFSWPQGLSLSSNGPVFLLVPDAPTIKNIIPTYYPLEVVNYTAVVPWPNPTVGQSILRTNNMLLASEPTAWSTNITSRIADPDSSPNWVSPIRQTQVQRPTQKYTSEVVDLYHRYDDSNKYLWVYILFFTIITVAALVGFIASLIYQITHAENKLEASGGD